MKKTFILLLLISSQQVFAQHSKWGLCYIPSLIENPEINYALQIGGTYDVRERLQLLSAITTSLKTAKNNQSENNHFFRLKTELRYFILKGKNEINPYIGVQTSFVIRSWNDLNGGSYYEKSFSSDSITNYTSAKIKSHSVAFTGQFGANAKMTKKLFFDLSIGLGVKFVFTEYSDLQDPSKQLRNVAKCKIFPAPNPAYWVNGTVARFQLNPAIGIQYHF